MMKMKKDGQNPNYSEYLANFENEQKKLKKGIKLENGFDKDKIKFISGIDLAYWEKHDKSYAVCCIVTIDYESHQIVETKYLSGEITVPYIAGYLSFRELPLILETYKLLEIEPDIVMFDGNGFLHYRNMGIATHASFYLDKPTIGVAKSYLKIENVEYHMPLDEDRAFTDIIIHSTVYGRALRTHKGVKPIFISCGNWIDIDTATDIVLNCINQESRQPIPIRLADIETRKMREVFMREHKSL
ncbi:endonuclease V [Paenibacillus thiaminolyticus]|uniref:endonuclease V n=1 Tax=Paenibacillus thiaminolyticus TaxID=49283 RepID=UPI00232F021E|nr:endonuclease V [Paenibacillus thiaminolyticus]WCF10752.1 endonuclease V [Paenibacillus thiaminolyticus]